MKRSPLRSPYLWAIVLVAAVVTAAWVGRDRYREAAVLGGSTAPDFAFPSLSGDEVRLSSLRGKVVLVNVWATWCVDCLREMPSMQRLYEALDGEDFEILAVSIDARAGDVDEAGRPGGDIRGWVDRFGLTFPILHDPSAGILRQYQTTGVPESFIVAPDGTIYRKVAGATEWDLPVNEQLVRRLLDS